MKKMNRNTAILIVGLIVLSTVACNKETIVNSKISSNNNEQTANENMVGKCNSNSIVFPPKAHMHGKSYGEWVAEWWKWNLQFSCANFPLQDIDGSRQNQLQSGPVYFLSGKRGNTLNVTVPKDKSIFFPAITYYEERPSVVPGVYQDLLNAVTGFVNKMDQLSVTVDGKAINANDYKIISPMFQYRANGDLANCYDSEISGNKQPFLAGGYFFMLKPLSRGQHIIHRVGGASSVFPFVFDITYVITQL